MKKIISKSYIIKQIRKYCEPFEPKNQELFYELQLKTDKISYLDNENYIFSPSENEDFFYGDGENIFRIDSEYDEEILAILDKL